MKNLPRFDINKKYTYLHRGMCVMKKPYESKYTVLMVCDINDEEITYKVISGKVYTKKISEMKDMVFFAPKTKINEKTNTWSFDWENLFDGN